MFSKEILGIYVGEHSLDYFLLKRTFSGWQKASLPLYTEPAGKTPSERLYNFLSQVRPRRGRRISLLIPRSKYYLRELKFPGLSPEEAEGAVKMAVGIHAHLPEEDIVHDCLAFERGGKSHVLLCYAKRTYIETLIDQVRDAGHGSALYCISPVGVGADVALRMNSSIVFPVLSVYKEEEAVVVNFHGESCWEGSHVFDANRQTMPPLYQRAKGVVLLGDVENPYPSLEAVSPCQGKLKELCSKRSMTLGILASLAGTSAYPSISLKPGRRRRPIRLRIDGYQLALVGVLLLIGSLTLKGFWDLAALEVKISHNSSVISKLNAEYKPLKAKEDELKKIEALEKDLNDFVKERPNLLEILREFAIRTPSNAWIKYLTVRGERIRVSAEGGYAVKTIESWRRSRIFKDVKLASPVTKGRDGQERYTVEMKLKKNQ